MARHAWAADRLWDGLVLPSNAAWEGGADAFAGVPLDTDDLAFDNPEGVRALANRTHELGRRAGLETEPSLRARTYGELLSACAACHQMTGQEPAIKKLDW
jgi:cytochrome c553